MHPACNPWDARCVGAQTQVVKWTRARLYPKQEAAIFERKRISVIEASTNSGKTEGAVSCG